MFKVDPAANRILPLEVKRLSDLGFGERKHLQEWLENAPRVFGEDLLFIQKEFDGFDETRERLDLLALDKSGNLVIIENKLDDSGRDVVWQVQKYAGYCANLNTAQVLTIFQRYLDAQATVAGRPAESASEKVREFLDVADLSERVLNRAQSQRLFLVATHFRPEVTNTVLWLNQFGIDCRCFKVTPYASGEDLFLDVEQIIPTPEARDFMVSMAAKESEERVIGDGLLRSESLRLEFWPLVLEGLRKSTCSLFSHISPSKDHWLSAGSGISAMPYSLIFSRSEVRVEFNCNSSDAAANTFVFDRLLAQKEALEGVFGAAFGWLPLPEKISCRLQYSKPIEGYNRQNWPGMVTWLVEQMTKLEQTLKDPLAKIGKEMKSLALAQRTDTLEDRSDS